MTLKKKIGLEAACELIVLQLRQPLLVQARASGGGGGYRVKNGLYSIHKDEHNSIKVTCGRVSGGQQLASFLVPRLPTPNSRTPHLTPASPFILVSCQTDV